MMAWKTATFLTSSKAADENGTTAEMIKDRCNIKLKESGMEVYEPGNMSTSKKES